MKHTIVILCSLLLLTFASCQKVIKVKLNNAASQYVIIGNVSDQPGPYLVSITKTVDFQQDNNFPPVSGAVVVITDKTAGISDTLAEATPGNYQTSHLAGVQGHTYTLYVKADGNTFTASSAMPASVTMDTLYQQAATFGDGFSIVPVYRDPAGVKNYYHMVQYVNNVSSKGLYIRGDDITDGQVIRNALDLGADTTIHVGDNVKVELQAIDSAIYTYYRNLTATINQNAASPANPQTNIVGGKLGYFSAHSITARAIVIHQ